MTTTKPQAIEKAIVDAECYGYVKPGSWRSLKASGVTARELSRSIGAWRPGKSEFDREIKALLESAITDAAKLQNDKDKLAARVAEFGQHNAALFARLDRVRTHYITRYRMWQVLADERRSMERAVTIDHLKLYFSRLVYALTIAGVVLLTGCLAKTFEIPLPMFRMP